MITVETITDQMIEAIRDAACECRPRPLIECPEDHATSHDCDVETYDIAVTALEADGDEAAAARYHCAAVVNDVMSQHGPDSAYWRALKPLLSASGETQGGR